MVHSWFVTCSSFFGWAGVFVSLWGLGFSPPPADSCKVLACFESVSQDDRDTSTDRAREQPPPACQATVPCCHRGAV